MPLFQAIGFGIMIIVLKVLTPEIFTALQGFIIGALTFGHTMLAAVSMIGTNAMGVH